VCHESVCVRQFWRNCIRDGSLASRGRPAGAGTKPPHAARSNDVVVSDEEKADSIRQVSDEKVSASEPSMTRRNHLQTLSKQESVRNSWISVGATCLRTTRQPAYRRHELIAGPDAERENLPWNAKGTSQVVTTMRVNTDVCGRGGATRSSDEGSVMDSEPRGCIIPFGVFHQLPTAGGMV